jgi:hypothetical protein
MRFDLAADGKKRFVQEGIKSWNTEYRKDRSQNPEVRSQKKSI